MAKGDFELRDGGSIQFPFSINGGGKVLRGFDLGKIV